MKEDKFNNEIMDFLDGISNEDAKENVRLEAEELKVILADLKEIPFEDVSQDIDARIYQFIESCRIQNKPVKKLRVWLPYLAAAAASILLLFFVFNNTTSQFENYQKLSSNPIKLNFIYDLNKKALHSDDITWLKAELKNEINPNIKVAIIDLLTNYNTELDADFYNHLQKETIPTVQMALLNSIEVSDKINFISELTSFSQRRDLDNAVKSKVSEILSNQ